ncbi:hypothetical protein WMF38_48310 [Sorangium sp. So ce118]
MIRIVRWHDRRHEAELCVAAAAGLIPWSDARALAREAVVAGASPLALLRARGVISETRASTDIATLDRWIDDVLGAKAATEVLS